jgi:hypothetical protein
MTSDECREPVPPLVRQGIAEFNRGEFFEQHESLETAWRAEPRPLRELYQGILQIGVACYQIERGNVSGALKLFERGLGRLRRFAPECQGIAVARLMADAERLRDEVARLGAERLAELDRAWRPIIHTRCR